MNLRDALTAASRPAPTKLIVEGVQADVYARTLTVGEVIDQQEDTKDEKNRPAIARAFARIITDENGAAVYDSKQPEDIQAILALPWPLVRRVMEQANKVNGVATSQAEVEKN
jgi:hypothetical protein